MDFLSRKNYKNYCNPLCQILATPLEPLWILPSLALGAAIYHYFYIKLAIFFIQNAIKVYIKEHQL